MARRVIPELAMRHVEDASFLWLQRDRSVSAPHYSLADLTKLDRRLEAQLDALRLDRELSVRLCRRALKANPEPGEAFTAAILAFEGGRSEDIDRISKRVAAKPLLARAVASALGWLPQATAAGLFPSLLGHESPAVRRAGLAGAVAHRLNPGTALERMLGDPDPGLRARALKAVGEMGYPVWLPVLRKHFHSDDHACRFAAAWSAARISDDRDAVAELMSIALIEKRFARRCAGMAARKLDPTAVRRWVRMLCGTFGLERLAIHAAAALGDSAFVPWLLERMAVPALARAAGEAFTWITGVDFAIEHLDGQMPAGFEAGPTEDPNDPNVELDPDDNLPWPDRSKVERWWASHRGRFPDGVRHLWGRPITTEWLTEVLRTGTQRLRAAAALELGLRQPRQPIYEVRAPGWRQC